MIFKGGVGARFRLGAHVPSTWAAGHATKTIALGCLPTGFSATEPFMHLPCRWPGTRQLTNGENGSILQHALPSQAEDALPG